jgi:uncharacterized protein with ATP-grasp and redox domains
VTDDIHVQKDILDEAMAALLKMPVFELSPAELSTRAIKIACEMLDDPDPYYQAKKKYNAIALEMEPHLGQILEEQEHPLFAALLLSVAGNIIDLGILEHIDIDQAILRVLENGLAVNDYPTLLRLLDDAEQVLIIGDNAGEIVFDKLLLKQLTSYEVFYAVRGGPIINDACLEDALEVGIDQLAKVITTGSDRLGITADCSPEFWLCFEEADVIIAKGQANFETLQPHPRLFNLLTCKCDLVASELGVCLNDSVLYFQGRL